MRKLQAIALASLTAGSLLSGALIGFGGGSRTVVVAASSSPAGAMPVCATDAGCVFDLNDRLASSGADLTREVQPSVGSADDAAALAGDDPSRHVVGCHCGRHG